MKQSPGVSRFTDYRSSCIRNQEIKKSIGTENPMIFRMALQSNAKCIAHNNLKKAYELNSLECSCPACKNTAKCSTCGKDVLLVMPKKL